MICGWALPISSNKRVQNTYNIVMKRPFLTVVYSEEDLEPVTLSEVIRLISMDAMVPSRLEIPTRPITGEDIDRAIRRHIDKLVEIYLEESRFRRPS